MTTMSKWIFIFIFITSPLLGIEERFLLITGCGRSGTQYTHDFLNKSGLQVGFEVVREHGSVSWLLTSEASWAPWGPLRKDFKFKHVFHQVRDPLKVIQSFYNVTPRATWEWVAETIKEININDPDLVKCAKYWIHWNLLAESKAEWTYRIEDFDKEYLQMAIRLKYPLKKSVLDTIPKTTNTKVKPDDVVITWELLKAELPPELYQQLVDLAKHYRYIK